MKKTSVLLFVFILLIFSCKKETKKTKTAPLPYPVISVAKRNVNTYHIFPTNITGINNNQLRPKISGYIKEVLVDEGEKVKKGQLLFKLETNIQDQNASVAKNQITSATANIEAARAQVESAQVEVNKLIPLVEKNIISAVQLETARANLLKAKGGLSQALAAHSSAEANYRAINENIKFSNITSPIDGVVGKFNYRIGALVSPLDSKPITTVSDVSKVYAYFTINEKQYIYFFQNFSGKTLEEKIKLVPPIELELANGTIYQEKGTLETSTGVIDPNTGTIQFRVKFDNKDGLLTNGNTGKVRIPRVYKNVLVIPESATFEQQGVIYAFKTQGDSAVATVIEPRDRVHNLIVVNKGVQEREKIIVKGIASLKNGTKITPKLVNIDSIIKIAKVQ
ncbi:efflux RND transporter periplasmic adaptor subunit [Tenacibaculum sp. UWU-22]|uniref:efflux RND transporter periplasmic adaptor subunit n=1 Tax=Tenacibaculum sp. UWU-22 TaxID=3234187 RepID=UPI0034DB46C9